MMEAIWRFKEYVAYAIAGLLGLLGLIIALVATIKWSDWGAITLLVGIGLGVLPMLVALWLSRSVWRSSSRRRLELTERQVLDLAVRTGGRLTALQVARATRLTLEESKSLLERLTLDGHCHVELAEDGTLSYRFGR